MPARQIFLILPRRVVCASTRSDASMAALVRAAAARRGRIARNTRKHGSENMELDRFGVAMAPFGLGSAPDETKWL